MGTQQPGAGIKGMSANSIGLAVIGLALLASGCGGDHDRGRLGGDTGAVRTIRVLRPPGKWVLNTIAWIPAPGVLVVAGDRTPPYLNTQLFTVHVDGRGSWRRVSPLSRRGCRATSAFGPVALGRRQVAFTEDCVNPRLLPNELKHIKAYSFRTRSVRLLFPYGLPFPSRAFALSSTGRRGVLNDGTGLEEQLRWLLPTSLSPQIRLGLERVGQPVWSPDQGVIAVSAAVDVSGVGGVRRSIASWRVYSGTRDLRAVKPLGKGMLEEDPDLAWSPDSQLLVVAALGREHAGKLMLVRRRDGRELILKRGHFGSVTWTSRTRIAVVHAIGDRGEGGEYIEVLDVAPAVARLEG
jgi:hypothetical protein